MYLQSQIARITRRYLNDSLLDLAPAAAPTPFMIAGGPHGVQHIGLHDLSDPDFPETARTAVPAFIVLAEAVELALGAFVSDRDRECAVIAHWGPSGRDVYSCSITRRDNQTPVLGQWRQGPEPAGLGAVDEGVRGGLVMAHRIWESGADDLRERIDAIRSAAGTCDTDSLPLTVAAMRERGWLG